MSIEFYPFETLDEARQHAQMIANVYRMDHLVVELGGGKFIVIPNSLSPPDDGNVKLVVEPN